MTLIRTNTLTGKALDWAVAKAEGYTFTSDGISILLERGDELKMLGAGKSPLNYSPSTNGSQGMEIIEREFIELVTTQRSNELLWQAIGRGFGEDAPIGDGPTALIAAMRSWATSKFGPEIEIPNNLLP